MSVTKTKPLATPVEEQATWAVKAYSKKDLCTLYNIRPRQLRSWLRPFAEEIGTYNGKAYTPKQVRIIFDKIGPP